MFSRMLCIIFMVLIVWVILMYFLIKSRHQNPYSLAPNTVSLSFNEGPNTAISEEIIKILSQKNIKATFFISANNAEKHPDLLSQAYKKGNAIACLGLNNQATLEQIEEDLKKCKNTIEKIIGKAPICYRPALKKMTPQLQDYIKSQNMVVIEDDISLVNEKNLTADEIVSHTLSLIRPQSIITLPKGLDKQDAGAVTEKALPILIEKIEKMGLGFSRICYP